MSDDDKKLFEAIYKLTDQVSALGWAIAKLTEAVKEALEELKRQKAT